jgi:hypothetical protein
MTCGMCRYEWCYVCGLPYLSIFHLSQFGGLICEIMGGSFFNKNKCCSVFLTLLISITLPVIIFVVGLIVTGCFIFYAFEYLINEKQYFKNLIMLLKKDFSTPKWYQKPHYILIRISKFLFFITILSLYISVTVVFGGALGLILIVPCYFIFIAVLIRI